MDVEVDHVGAVTIERYKQIIEEARHLLEEHKRIQFRLGDFALETEPMQPVGGYYPSYPEIDTVHGALSMLAEDLGIPVATLTKYRWVASRWPNEYRQAAATWWVYKVLSSDPERFTKIYNPPKNLVTGRPEWSTDMAAREVGNTPEIPRTRDEKINKVHELVREDGIASTIVKQLLYRPEVAHQAMADSTARLAVNRAQVSRTDSIRHEERAQLPSVARVEHGMGFYELTASSNAYVAATSRGIAALKSTHLSDEEKAVLRADLKRVRAAADCVEQCLNDESDGLEAALAKILEGGAL